jgi:hypothetical protein
MVLCGWVRAGKGRRVGGVYCTTALGEGIILENVSALTGQFSTEMCSFSPGCWLLLTPGCTVCLALYVPEVAMGSPVLIPIRPHKPFM